MLLLCDQEAEVAVEDMEVEMATTMDLEEMVRDCSFCFLSTGQSWFILCMCVCIKYTILFKCYNIYAVFIRIFVHKNN